ncbi:MAG: transporter substrate-binding domain-containing protein [Firmicutes bacterium]|nr:transporter substrate-binding domain-containing protein [Bacillota bacterium]
MKKIAQNAAALLLAGALAAGAAGCSGGAAPANAGAAGDIGLLKPGTLTVGCEIGYPPFELFADDGTTPMGLDIDLGKALADQLGVGIVHQNTAWDGIFAGLDANKYDCVISAVTISADRRLTMDFTQPYIQNWQCIVVKKGSAPVANMDGLNGLKVGYQGSTTSDEYLHQFIDTGKITCTTNPYDKILQCFDDLKLGRIDAVICDSTVADGYIAREPDSYDETWLQSAEKGAVAEEFGIAVKKGNTKLTDALNGALAELKSNGKLDEIIAKWMK